MNAKTLTLLCLVSWLLLGCTSCSENGNNDTGTVDSDTDSDSDTDTDSDTDADTETETVTTQISDAGPWDWEDLPESEDCGPACEQLTFGEVVRSQEWDVWADLLTYKDETRTTNVIDIANRKHLLIPNIHPEFPIGTLKDSFTFYPVVY